MFRYVLLYSGNNFYALLILALSTAFLAAPIGSLINNSVLELLGEKKADYGKQRLWGVSAFFIK